MNRSLKSIALALSFVVALGAASPADAAPRNRSAAEQKLRDRDDSYGRVIRNLLNRLRGLIGSNAEPTVPIP
ncbi:MAG TPA: hypothetical protein VF618_24070 [Thermoanaerobaculia bacterium]